MVISFMKTADLCDDFADQLVLCKLNFRSFGKKDAFHGVIRTVEVFDDNVLVKDSLETIEPGSVLIVDGGGSTNCALLGDRLAAIATERNINGIIINGCVRDSQELSKINTGIFALGTCPFKSKKHGEGCKNTTLHFGEVEWIPGQYVYADADGVLTARSPVHL